MTPDELFSQTLERLLALDPAPVDMMGAAILASVHAGLARDTRTFARHSGVSLSLVLRACNVLAEAGLVSLEEMTDRSQRKRITLTKAGRSLVMST